MINFQIFAGFPQCNPADIAVAEVLRILVYILVGCIMYLVCKRVLKQKNKLALLLIPIAFIVILCTAFYAFVIITFAVTGLCGGTPLLFPVGFIENISILDSIRLFIYILLPLILIPQLILNILRFKKKPTNQNKTKVKHWFLGFTIFILLVVVYWLLVSAPLEAQFQFVRQYKNR
ncbi:MAG: hypothetical protein ABIR46_00100 [Candidatus Saccharimonadales bacterium]